MVTDSLTLPSAPGREIVHPLWLRVLHWINALAVLMMVTSGWQVYNASPLYGFSFPPTLTLGGWLGGGLQWHFAAMWLLIGNGLLYLAFGLATGRFRRRLLPVTLTAVAHDASEALHGRLSHDDPTRYNALQKVAYLLVILDIAVLFVSGLVLWKSVQFATLRDLLGGYEFARRIHFWAMSFLVTFVAGHVALAALVPRSIVAMLTGRSRT